jgi:uncharacterized OB-fold protein
MLAEVTSVNAPFFEAARRGELALQRCEHCLQVRYPPASRCPSCLSPASSWAQMSGTGTLFSWIVMHRRYLAGFDDVLPYPVGLVALDEGPLVLTRLLGDPASLRCDQRVEVEFEDLSAEISVPVFRVVVEADPA